MPEKESYTFNMLEQVENRPLKKRPTSKKINQKNIKKRKQKKLFSRLILILSVIIILIITIILMICNNAFGLKEKLSKGNVVETVAVLQKPELPSGSEVTSLTTVLNFNGFKIDKKTLSEKYLPKKDFVKVKGELYGSDPKKEFAGNPANDDGFYCFTQPLVETANAYLKEQKSNLRAYDISGATYDVLKNYTDKGQPVILWTLRDFQNFQYSQKSWIIADSGVKYVPFSNLHCVVFNGYKDFPFQKNDETYFSDPLKGNCKEGVEWIIGYEKIGRLAIVIK